MTELLKVNITITQVVSHTDPCHHHY